MNKHKVEKRSRIGAAMASNCDFRNGIVFSVALCLYIRVFSVHLLSFYGLVLATFINSTEKTIR